MRYLFVHYGQWSFSHEVGQLVEAQLKRFESAPGPPAPCFDLGLLCAPRSAPTADVLRAAVAVPGLTSFSTIEHGDKLLVFAVVTWPTDSESYITVLAWSYTAHFREWRLVLHQEVYGAIAVSPVLDVARAAVVVKTRDPEHPEALVLPLAHIPTRPGTRPAS